MKKIYHGSVIIILLILLTGSSGFSQASSEWSLGITPVIYQAREEIITGKRFSSLGIIFRPQWNKEKGSLRHEVSLEVGFAQPKTSLEPGRASAWVDIGLKYSLDVRIAKGKAGSLYIGGKVMADYQIQLLSLWDDSHMFWATFAGLGPQIRWVKQVKEKNRVFAEFSFPVFGMLSRPPAYWDTKVADITPGGVIGSLHDGLAPVTINRFFNPLFEVGYMLKQSNKFSLAFRYMGEYLYAKSSGSNAYVSLIHGIGIQFIF